MEIMEKILRMGHSPDADDAFMFYALGGGFVGIDGFKVRHVVEDIQSLNQRALKSELEVTAVSAAVFPSIADRYWIMASGASVGRNYGPIVATRSPLEPEKLTGKKIAVPGKLTTAYLLLKIFLKDFTPVEVDFDDVIPVVQRGEADAALVIHEGQLKFESLGFFKVLDLGEIWYKKFNLPIPLGLDLVRKDLGLEAAKKIQGSLRESILFAMAHEKDAMEYASQYGRKTPKELLKKFVGMYVNQDTLDLGAEGKKALEKLFTLGKEAGLVKSVPQLDVIDG